MSANGSALDKPPSRLKAVPKSRRRSATWWSWLLTALVAVVVVLGIAVAVKWWFFPDTGGSGEITATVTRGDLPIIVTERGELDSSKTEDIRCSLEGRQNKIVEIVPEGTRVTKDQIVARLDADELTREAAKQESVAKQARGKADAAKEELEVQKNKAASDIAKAKLALTLAELDLEKYVKAEFKIDFDDKMGAIKLAERELEDAKDKLKNYETFVKKGFGVPEQLTLKNIEVQRAEANLERDKNKLMLLKDFQRRRQETELTAKAEDAKLELERTQRSSAAAVTKAKAEMDAAEQTAKIEEDSLKRFKKQLGLCEIKSPADGIMVYTHERDWDPSYRIQTGGVVFYQETLARLPDLNKMEVKARVHESKVKKIKIGQKAEIRIEAHANVVLHGTVNSDRHTGRLGQSVVARRRQGIPHDHQDRRPADGGRAVAGHDGGGGHQGQPFVRRADGPGPGRDAARQPVRCLRQGRFAHRAAGSDGRREQREIHRDQGRRRGGRAIADGRPRPQHRGNEGGRSEEPTTKEINPMLYGTYRTHKSYRSHRSFGFPDCTMSLGRTWHLIRLSIYNLRVHWLRSLLMILGILLGVASVIVMLAVGEAARRHAVQQIEELGATNIIVRSVKPTEETKDSGNADDFTYGVTTADWLRITTTIPTIRSVTPMREFRKDVRYLDHKLEGRVVSVLPEYERMNGLKIAKGRFISALDNERYENFCVLGADTADTLFPVEDPIGRTVRIDENQYFRVIGVTEKKASSAGVGSSLNATDYNRDVYIPFGTDRVRFGPVLTYYKAGTFKRERLEISQLTIVVDRMENVKKTAEVIQGTLEQYHTRKDTELTVPLDLLERAEKTQRLFTQVLAAIASISLIVGGIGIMNIMLATVTERTREIGLRRALGAKRRDIAWQFLFETVTLTSLGGLLGIAVGIGVSYLVEWLFGFPTLLRVWSSLLAFAVSVGVGLVFGIFPALRAARLDPIEALRHE